MKTTPHKRAARVVAGGLALVLAACAGSGTGTGPATATLDQALQAVVDDPVHGMASLSVLAIRDGKVSYERQFGQRRRDDGAGHGDLPANRETMYRVASISKMVTTLGVMRLLEQGKLSLDEDVSRYLGFWMRNPAFPAQPITLRMLLSHTSSLRDGAGYSWGAQVSLREAMQRGEGMWATNAGPGRYFAYSNLNFGVVGTIMEKVTGERFDLLMQRLVLQPMGLRGGYNVAAMPPAQWADVATLYRKRVDENSPWNRAGPWVAQVDDTRIAAPPVAGLDTYIPGRNGTLFSPTGGLRISATGLGKIMMMLMHEGQHEGGVFLQPASIAAMMSRQWTRDAAGANGDTHDGLFAAWGQGLQHFEAHAGARSSLVQGGGFKASGHLGDAYGLLSVFAFDAASRSGMVVLIGGTASDPASTPGQYSALSRQEELVLMPLYHQAVLPPR